MSSSTPFFTPQPYFAEELRAWLQDLYRAAHRGEWEATSKILQRYSAFRTAALNTESETALHIAVGTGKAIHYVEKLIDAMHPNELEIVDKNGQTPLTVASIIGNTEAAKLLVRKNPNLLYICDADGLLPVHTAARYDQKDILLYLLKVTSGEDPSPYKSKSGAQLLAYIMEAEFYDVATSLVTCFPELIDESFIGEHSLTSPLTTLAGNPSAFSRMNWRSRLIYACTPAVWKISFDNYSIGSRRRGDEYQLQESRSPWRISRHLAFFIDRVRPTKSTRDQALQLVKYFCDRASASPRLCSKMFEEPFHLAAESGIVEIVEELAEIFPDIFWVKNKKKQNILQVAVLFRQERVFNLIYRKAEHKRYQILEPDIYGNNILHMAGKMAPPHRLNPISSPAWMMQSELQWFKEVGKSIPPFQRKARNNAGQTPNELFTEQHRQLVKEGEMWLKRTARSSTTPAALIATVTFAAAIAPSTSNMTGRLPYFPVIDALAFLSSIISLTVFLSILTSQYREEEFLSVLPQRMYIGIATLLFSIMSMMGVFSMIFSHAFNGSNIWSLFPVLLVAGLLYIRFLSDPHFDLLLVLPLIWSSPRISGKRGARPLYNRRLKKS